MYDVIIIGGGAAGLSAAMYALGKRLDFLLIAGDVSRKAGTPQYMNGQSAPQYLAGSEVLLTFERRIAVQPGRAMRDKVIEVKKFEDHLVVVTGDHGELHCLTVIIATGARPVWLEIPGARALLGYGLGYSVTTHAALLRRKRVAILGMTVRSLRGAAEIASSAEQIYLVANDPADADTPLANVLKRWPHIEIITGYTAKEVLGDTAVEGLLLQRGDTLRRLDVDAVFVDHGLMPQSKMVQDLVQTDPDGFVWVDERNMTTQPGVFAAGDVCVAFGEQVLIAIGDGARAALSAYDYILARRLARLQPVEADAVA